MKRLISLISTEGKSVEQIAKEGWEAFQTYQTVSEEVKQEMLQEEAMDMENKKFQVYNDDNAHYQDESYRHKVGEYDTLEEAIIMCRDITEVSLDEVYTIGMTAKELINLYRHYGDDPWIYSYLGGVIFSAWNYVEREAQNFIDRKQQHEINPSDTTSN